MSTTRLCASTCLRQVLTQRWVLWVLKWVLVFVQVFAEYSYAHSGVLQRVLVSTFVVEWAKHRYIGLFYILQSILKSSNKPHTCCWGSPPMWTELFCCIVAVRHWCLQCCVLLHRSGRVLSSRTHGVVCLCIIAVGCHCCVSLHCSSQASLSSCAHACLQCRVLLCRSGQLSLSLCAHGVTGPSCIKPLHIGW